MLSETATAIAYVCAFVGLVGGGVDLDPHGKARSVVLIDAGLALAESRCELDAHTGVCSVIDLKPVCVSDAELIFESWGRYPQNFARLTARVFMDVGDAERYLSSLFSAPASKAFHIVGSGGAVVGIVKAIITEHRAQVGYVVHEPFRGRGFATRAVDVLVERLEADPSISRIWATCALDNPASTRVLEKCGFQREGVLKNWVVYPALGNRATDNYSYVKVAQVTGGPTPV